MGIGRRTSTLRKAAKQFVLAACGSFSFHNPPSSRAIIKQDNCSLPRNHDEAVDKSDSSNNTLPTSAILCAICLEPLSHCDEAMFTGQCSHSFHFSCIASNVRHGSVTCPVCRAHWTHLPCSSFPSHQLDDPIVHVLDDSIAAFRVHRCSFLRSARYDDDDPIDHPHSTGCPRLGFSLTPLIAAPNLVSYPCCLQSLHLHQAAYSPSRTGLCTNHNLLPCLPKPEEYHCLSTSLGKRNAYLSVKLNRQPIDLVLIVTPSGPHLQLLKQAMMLVTFSLRPIDRLSIIVTYPCVGARMLALRCMTSCGKRAALRVIDRLLYMGETDPSQGIRKGIKVLKDRAYKNPRCSILHICSSSPIRPSYFPSSLTQMGVMVHTFNLGFGIETWNGFVLPKLEELLEKVLGGVASDIQLRIGMEGKIVKVGELRGGEERQILVDLVGNIRLCYSYVEGDTEECIRRRGETTLSFNNRQGKCEAAGLRRSIRSETWDHHDHHLFMARRLRKTVA